MTKEPAPIMLETIIAELDRLGVGRQEQEGQTVNEMADAWGRSREYVQAVLGKAMRAGILRSGRAPRPRICGGTMQVPVYWFEMNTPKAGKKGKRR